MSSNQPLNQSRMGGMLLCYVATMLLSSGLLFAIQPMFARMVLPLLGGSPGVWNTCMVYFQAALLAGYLYAHLSTRWLGVRRQAVMHLGLIILPLLVLPVAIDPAWAPPASANPVWALLLLLTVTVGPPFFVISSSAPLLQRWFSRTGHREADDPYFLYAASNVGSMSALLAYPALMEPLLGLRDQSVTWSLGYLLLVVMIGACAFFLFRTYRGGARSQAPASAARQSDDGASPGRWRQRFRWLLLAAAPSSLMLGVTTFITSDIAVTPLLWVVPLAIYLASFILVFARRRLIPHVWMVRAWPIAAVALLIVLITRATEPVTLLVTAHLVVFFIACMVCHGELVRTRPPVTRLTEFYLLMSIGGVLGGAFNALLAPLVFTDIVEYPLMVVIVCLLAPSTGAAPQTEASGSAPASFIVRWFDLVAPLAVGGLTLALLALANRLALEGPLRSATIIALPALLCFLLSARSLRFALCVAVVLLAGGLDTSYRGNVLAAKRSFFGVHRVTYVNISVSDFLNEEATYHRLYHGTTLHGAQHADPETSQPIEPTTPLVYYHRLGPVGLFWRDHGGRVERAGVIGLGAGMLAAYLHEGQELTYFEIDPLVQAIAENERYFTYISAARERGATVETILGDARLTLDRYDGEPFDLLVLDAFSSDAIPVHLLTREAMRLYLDHLQPDGALLMNISNRHFDLKPLVAALADELDLVCYFNDDTAVTEDMVKRMGRESSVWALLVRQREHLEPMPVDALGSGWNQLPEDERVAVWTDDYANILSVFMW